MQQHNTLDCEWNRQVVHRRSIDVPWGELGHSEPYPELLVAGQRVTAGRYRRVDIPFGEIVDLGEGDHLPASLDGHVAAYERLPKWCASLRNR